VPAPIIEKGLASDRVVIDAVIAKYCDHLPLYRQSAMFLRDAGVEISRVTMSGWMMRVGDLLAPVVAAMRLEVLPVDRGVSVDGGFGDSLPPGDPLPNQIRRICR